jgi:hypothetical protein
MDENMTFPSPSLKTVLLALLALAAATSGLALASSAREDGGAGRSASAAQRPALGKARVGRARVAGAKRKTRNGTKAPVGSPGLVTAAPAARVPEPALAAAAAAAAPIPDLPGDPAPPASPAPAAPEAPAPGEPPAPEPPAPEAAPAPEEPPAPAEEPPAPEEPAPPVEEPPAPEEPPAAEEPPAPEPPPLEEGEPIPAPEPSPPPPQTSTPDIDPGVPLEPEPSPAGGLVVGIDGGYAGWSGTEVGYRAQLGAAVTRHEWSPAQPVDEQDEEVRIAAEKIHTRIHALLGGNRLGDATHYREWVVAFVRRYGIGGSFWAEHPGLDESRYAITTVELGNEPYFGAMSDAEYADTVRPTLERIRELDLPVTVVLPVYLHGEDVSWIDNLYERIPSLNSLFDAFAFHPYWYGHSPSASGDGGAFERLDTLRQRMDELGAAAKPIYLTEYGESTAACGSECVSEEVQAAHLSEMLEAIVTNVGWKVEMLSVFQLLDRGTASPDRELQFGLLRQNGTAKPAYPIVRAAMQLYR